MFLHRSQAFECTHDRVVEDLDLNDNRTRTRETCATCQRRFFGCLAKRLDEDGNEAWGPVGRWWWTQEKLG
ncbi:MAG TPA: hypothetical protein VF765_31225 [Polyangiaceae bacterium]